MALTRIVAETILVSRLGPVMEVAVMAVSYTGGNTDLDDPLAWATRGVGGSTAAHNTVTDAELARVAVGDFDDLMALAEWRTLLNIQGALDAVDVTVGPRKELLSQYADKVQQMLDRLEPLVNGLGLLTAPLEAGYITIDIAEHD